MVATDRQFSYGAAAEVIYLGRRYTLELVELRLQWGITPSRTSWSKTRLTFEQLELSEIRLFLNYPATSGFILVLKS